MTNFGQKLRVIFIPFLIITISSLLIYSFLRWLLFIRTTLFIVDEDILNLLAPMALVWIPLLIWLRPRIKLLDLKSKNKRGDPLFGYLVFAWMAMLAPIVVAQDYLVSATGKLTEMSRISQIDSLPKTKYYKVKSFYVDKNLPRFKTRFKTSGRYNADFDMYIYIAIPVYDKNHTVKTYNYKISSPNSTINSNNALIVLDGKVITSEILSGINPKSIKNITVLKSARATALYGNAASSGVIVLQTNPAYKGTDTLQVLHDDNMHYAPSAWIGVRYTKTISNHLSLDEKNQRYQEFAKESQSDFKAKRLDNFVYLDRVAYGDDLKNYVEAIKSNKSINPPVIFTAINEAFETRNRNEFAWIFGSMGIGSAIFMITLLFKPLKDKTLVPDTEEEGAEDGAGFFSVIKTCVVPQKRLLITQLLIQANLLIFVIMACAGLGFLTFNAPDLLKLGANYRPSIDKGEYWRLLTSIFLHGGLMHVLMNMYGLFFVGLFLEPLMGRGKYLLTYLGCGIIASIASVWWHPATISVGASGAIFGLFGTFLALITLNFFPQASKRSLLINTSIFVGYNLLFGLTGGIDNAAHVGGLLSGLIFGYVLSPLLRNKVRQENTNKDTNQFLDGLSNKPE